MESLSGLLAGFDVVFSPGNLLIVFTGVTIGMVVGVLPGLGPTATIALLLPVTYALDPATAIMMLAGVYYGSMYGGTITAVLLNIPGEASSVITAIDGHQMARRGRAGPAIGTAAIGSAIGGFVSAILLVFLAPAAANVALGIGPPDLTAIVALGIILAAYLGTKSFVKALIGVGIGLLLATVGQDPITGTPRFSFGNPDLAGGLEFAAIAMGIFGIGEILFNIRDTKLHHQTPTVGRVLPSREDLRRSGGPISRGTIVGYILGLLPGSGGMVPPLASYAIEKRISKNRDEFGEGAIEGVAGPETASNAGAQAAFVPLLTLGLPTTSVLALMFGALMIQGVTPGPALITENPDIFWGVIASMFIGNIFLLGLNIPLIGIFVQLLRIPLSTLGPIAILITLVGVY